MNKEILVRALLKYINRTPELGSLLYDLDLLPEQLEPDSFQWRQMLTLTRWHHFMATRKETVKTCDERQKQPIKPCNESWVRARFHANEDDYRPIKWPPPGPYWCSGFGDGYSIVIAYVRNESQIMEYWPEASEIELDQRHDITYTDRFPKPEWYSQKEK